jgi:hypothetical protein
MANSKSFIVGLAVVWNLFFACGWAAAQARFTGLSVQKFPQPDGTVKYQLETSQVALGFFGVPIDGGTLVAPDGTQFTSPSGSIERNSFDELHPTLFGEWTAIERPTLGPERSYRFQVAPYSLSDVFTETPVITSPLNGSVVSEDFTVVWTFPSGAMPTSDGFSAFNLQNLDFVDADLASKRVDVRTKLQGPEPGEISLRVSTSTNLTMPPITMRDPAFDSASIVMTNRFRSNSLVATYQVVPEPSGFVLTIVPLLSCVGALRPTHRSDSAHNDS